MFQELGAALPMLLQGRPAVVLARATAGACQRPPAHLWAEAAVKLAKAGTLRHYVTQALAGQAGTLLCLSLTAGPKGKRPLLFLRATFKAQGRRGESGKEAPPSPWIPPSPLLPPGRTRRPPKERAPPFLSPRGSGERVTQRVPSSDTVNARGLSGISGPLEDGGGGR